MLGPRHFSILIVAVALAALAGCGGSSSSSGKAAATTQQGDACAKGNLDLQTPGRLTDVESGPPADILAAPSHPETQRFLRRLLEGGRL